MEQPVDRLTDNATIDHFASDISGTVTNKSSVSSMLPLMKDNIDDNIMRGRPMQRTVRSSNPFGKAESRHRMNDATVEVDVHGIKARSCRSVAFFEDPCDPRAAFEDNLLEPCPHEPICNSVSEIISKLSRSSQNGVDIPNPVAGFVRTNSNSFHDIRKLLACSRTPLLGDGSGLPLRPTPIAEAVRELLPKFGQIEHKSIKSSDEAWYSTTNSERKSSLMGMFPAEVLCQIYDSLSPADFNSARHTCRLWYINSLDHSLLETMLKRGGWSTSVHNEIASKHAVDLHARINEEWLMSKRIARECALGPDWTGNGLHPTTRSLRCFFTEHVSKQTPFTHTSTTDFTEIGVHYPGVDNSTSGITFTVSTCGKFLMVTHGCIIYIYEMNRNQNFGEMSEDGRSEVLRPVTSVICPRRVLACSMDTSSHRYAIAALLDGRMGLVCDLTSLRDRNHRLSTHKHKMNRDASLSRNNEYRGQMSTSSSRSHGLPRTQTDQPFVLPVITAQASTSNLSPEAERNVWDDIAHAQVPIHSISPAAHSRAPIRILFGQNGFQSRATNLFPSYSMPIEQSIPTLYAPLCSADDMPRSVALCPQRRCVAFGCSSGIELHWVDALTGQDLNRWFPLTAPSDYLYFLPPRPGIDSAKKLRLISSAGRPGQTSAIAERYGGTKSGNNASPFWDVQAGKCDKRPASVAAAFRIGLSTPSRDNSDHYRAVPLSDGYHILFTDPATGFLCLGSDAPIGGPTKLLRKIWFAGPQGQGSPVTYVGGNDLRCGVRVVAAYGHGLEQSIWLFSVPLDVFTESQAEQGGINLPFSGISTGMKNGNRDWVKWWCTVDSQNPLEPIYGSSNSVVIRHDRLWPIQVRGQEIGKCHGVVDLAIDSGPEMTIWAYGKDGIAKTWQIDNGRSSATDRKFYVMRDGTIRPTSAGYNVQMVDNPLPIIESPPALRTPDQETYDGSTSMANSGVLLEQKVWNCQSNDGQDVTYFDADGDVLMTDLSSMDDHAYEPCSAELYESVSLAQNGDEVLFHHDGFSSPAHIRRTEVIGQDLVDVLTGIARIDIEIH